MNYRILRRIHNTIIQFQNVHVVLDPFKYHMFSCLEVIMVNNIDYSPLRLMNFHTASNICWPRCYICCCALFTLLCYSLYPNITDRSTYCYYFSLEQNHFKENVKSALTLTLIWVLYDLPGLDYLITRIKVIWINNVSISRM